MAIRRTLTRLLRLKELEEEQCRMELEEAVGNRNRIRQDMAIVMDRQLEGRKNFADGINRKDAIGRMGGAMEIEAARLQQHRIRARLEDVEVEVARQREEFLLRRTGRQQVETLADNERVTAEAEASRRAQQMLDDWYGRRRQKGAVQHLRHVPNAFGGTFHEQ